MRFPFLQKKEPYKLELIAGLEDLAPKIRTVRKAT